jgi:ATP-dependent Clp protease, protease subunit
MVFRAAARSRAAQEGDSMPRMPHSIRFDDDDDDREEKPETQGVGALIGKRLFETRTITIFGEISMRVAERVSAQLMALAAESSDDIRVVINSPGGHVEAGDTIHDMFRFVKPRVKVLGTGWVASAGALIFVGAERGDRFALPNTRFMLHQPMGGARGQAVEIEIEALEIIKMRQRLNELFARETGQPIEKVTKDTDRNFWMSANEAKDYGLVSHVISRFSDFA